MFRLIRDAKVDNDPLAVPYISSSVQLIAATRYEEGRWLEMVGEKWIARKDVMIEDSEHGVWYNTDDVEWDVGPINQNNTMYVHFISGNITISNARNQWTIGVFKDRFTRLEDWELSQKVETQGQNLRNLQVQVGDNTDRIEILEEREVDLSPIEARLDLHETRINNNEARSMSNSSAIAALKDRVQVNESGIQTNASEISGIKTRVANTEAKNTAQDTTLGNHETRIKALEALGASQLPVGFIYIQLPSQPEPKILYPNAKWQNISSSFAGNFFRVEGGNAAAYGSAAQLESVPNITGNIGSTSTYRVAPSGAFSGSTNDTYGGGSHQIRRTEMNASRSHTAYGRRNEVAPKNQTIRIWRKTGEITGYSRFSLIDDDGVYQDTVELGEDEAGIIGYNPHLHIETKPNKSLLKRMSTFRSEDSKEVLVYDREAKKWEMKVDHRGKTAYKKEGGSRTIFELGDDLKEDETWEAPVVEEPKIEDTPSTLESMEPEISLLDRIAILEEKLAKLELGKN